MKQLYSAKDGLEAHEVRLLLESRDIPAKVVGDNSALEAGFSFTPASAPCIFVAAEDYDRALAILQEYLSIIAEPQILESWKCPQCGQLVEAQFDACWKCESPRGDDLLESSTPLRTSAVDVEDTVADDLRQDAIATTASFPQIETATEDKREVWFELVAVLALTWFPYFVYGLLPDLYANETTSSFVADGLWSVVNCISIVTVVTYIMYRSNVPWAAFGIRRPRLILDCFWGLLVWMATTVVIAMLYGIAAVAVGSDQVTSFSQSSYEFPIASEAFDFVVVVVLSLAVGLSEELAMRSYLIPRLEYLLNSTWKSVLVSSLLFASYHLYQGFGPAVDIFVVGLSFGCAFCWLRRLWPLVWAHAIMDVIAFSSSA